MVVAQSSGRNVPLVSNSELFSMRSTISVMLLPEVWNEKLPTIRIPRPNVRWLLKTAESLMQKLSAVEQDEELNSASTSTSQ